MGFLFNKCEAVGHGGDLVCAGAVESEFFNAGGAQAGGDDIDAAMSMVLNRPRRTEEGNIQHHEAWQDVGIGDAGRNEISGQYLAEDQRQQQ